jgi:hypothetical protein
MTAGSTKAMTRNVVDHECLRLVRCPCAPGESTQTQTRCMNAHQDVRTPNRGVDDILSVPTGFHDNR